MIDLHTRLSEGIYRSQGGGRDLVAQSWTTGPRNVVAAISALTARRAETVRCYGNVGCGQTWLTVDGVTLDDADMAGVICAEAVRRDWAESHDYGPRPPSQTGEATALLARLGRARQASEAARTLGSIKTAKKAAASRANLPTGGRPPAGPYYTTWGSTRGDCGHAHRTVEAAQECQERDQAGCRSQGGHSDRHLREIVRMADVDRYDVTLGPGVALDATEAE